MLFNSLEFLAFILVVLAVHYLLVPARFERARRSTLLIASYAFYMSWNPPFVLLLWFSTGLDFVVAQRMATCTHATRRRLLLALSLLGNLGMLAFFKYADFLLEVFYGALGSVWSMPAAPQLEILLPIGISFYTFQTLSYSIDVYRGKLEPTRSLLDFAVYVSFFPQLVAGPIVRASEFLPQLGRKRVVEPARVESAFMRIGTGLVKKVVFADSLGSFVDVVFASPEAFGGLDVLLAIYAYAYQIYFDFSGYSDIAIGLAALFGFRIPENFNRPYLAANVREFWQRWHISLSTWLRDYLYVPLGGNRASTARTSVNLLVTMLLGGLWHGAAWNFVLWGAYHGALLMGHRKLTSGGAQASPRFPLVLRRCATFHLVCIGWFVFRTQSLEQAGALARRLTSVELAHPEQARTAFVLLSIAAAVHLFSNVKGWRRALLKLPTAAQGLVYALITLLVIRFSVTTQQFIYFQF